MTWRMPPKQPDRYRLLRDGEEIARCPFESNLECTAVTWAGAPYFPFTRMPDGALEGTHAGRCYRIERLSRD